MYDDVVAEVVTELTSRLDVLTAQGLDIDHIVVDPGLGFAKRAEQLSLLAHLDALQALGRPVLVGTRLRFLGTLLADDSGAPGRDRRADATTAMRRCLREALGVRPRRRRGADAVRVVAPPGPGADGDASSADCRRRTRRSRGQAGAFVDLVLHGHAQAGRTAFAVHWRAAAEVVAVVEGEPVNLIETLAARITPWLCRGRRSSRSR